MTVQTFTLRQKLVKKVYLTSVAFVLGLAIIALTMELLPEAEAKIVVVPTLVSIIALCSFELLGLNRGKFPST
jgi:hypothetical protein